MIKDNSNKLELKYIDQRFDGLEAWIRYNDSEWIRLDFILEFYLFNNVNLTKHYKEQFNNEGIVREYCELLFTKFSENTSNGSKFDFIKYLDWKNNNQSHIIKARNLLLEA